MAYSKLAEGLIEDEWRDDKSATAKLITERVNLRLAEQEKPTGERVVERTVSGYLAKIRKRFQEPAPDPILPMWQKSPETGCRSNLASWPTDPEKIKTLTILYDEARFIIPEWSPDAFFGLPDRMVKWALRISGFFDHEHRIDRLMHLWFVIVFSAEERFLIGMERDESKLGIQSGYTRGLMSWYQRYTEPGRPQFLPDPPWEMSVEDLASQVAGILTLEMGLSFHFPLPLNLRNNLRNRVFHQTNQENLAPNKTRSRERPRVFEASEAQVMIAAIMESYPGRLSEEKIKELVNRLERTFAEIDARDSAD